MTTEPDYSCIVCGQRITERSTSIGGSEYATHHGTIFSSAGNYGSTEWDPMVSGVELVIAVCNECLTKKRDRAIVERIDQGPVTRTYIDWEQYRGV